MDDSLPVCLVERVGNLHGGAERVIEWERASCQPLGQSLAFQILHHQEVDPALTANVINGTDVWMAQCSEGLGFPLESLSEFGIRRDVLGQDFDSDGTVEAGVGSTIHLAHATHADLRGNFVRAEAGAGYEDQWRDYTGGRTADEIVSM